MPRHTEADREVAASRVAKGEALVERQMALVDSLKTAGRDASEAKRVLFTMRATIIEFRLDLALIEADLDGTAPPPLRL